MELGGDGTIDGSPRDYLGSIAIAKWRLGIYLFLVFDFCFDMVQLGLFR